MPYTTFDRNSNKPAPPYKRFLGLYEMTRCCRKSKDCLTNNYTEK
jgi:hypothetical protein